MIEMDLTNAQAKKLARAIAAQAEHDETLNAIHKFLQRRLDGLDKRRKELKDARARLGGIERKE